MTSKSILLVEDDPNDMDLTLGALEEHKLPAVVSVVRDGEEALDYLYRRGKFKDRTTGDPSVVLLDLKMPKINGLEVLKAIKADEHLKTIPVVVLTSSRETQDLAECYRHGANAYVVKPVEYAEFKRAVQQLGVFWATCNELPPIPWKKVFLGQNGRAEHTNGFASRNDFHSADPASQPSTR